MDRLKKTIRDIPQLPQVQFDTQSQLEILSVVANRLGLYDARDFLVQHTIKKAPTSAGPKPRDVYY